MLTACSLSTDGLEAKANPGAQGVPAVRQRPAAARDVQGHGPLQPAIRRERGDPRAVGPGRRHLPGAHQVCTWAAKRHDEPT